MCYGDAAKPISNVIMNGWVRYGNSAHVGDGCRQQLCIQNCGQIAANRPRDRVDSLIGTRHRPIYNGKPIIADPLRRTI